MHEVVIVAATRTAIGSFQGGLASIPAPQLGATIVRRLLEQTGVAAEQVDEVSPPARLISEDKRSSLVNFAY